jgi:hypothetical protein
METVRVAAEEESELAETLVHGLGLEMRLETWIRAIL